MTGVWVARGMMVVRLALGGAILGASGSCLFSTPSIEVQVAAAVVAAFASLSVMAATGLLKPICSG